jgi:hypothetical protein
LQKRETNRVTAFEEPKKMKECHNHVVPHFSKYKNDNFYFNFISQFCIEILTILNVRSSSSLAVTFL